jgi:hypothetical protein
MTVSSVPINLIRTVWCKAFRSQRPADPCSSNPSRASTGQALRGPPRQRERHRPPGRQAMTPGRLPRTLCSRTMKRKRHVRTIRTNDNTRMLYDKKLSAARVRWQQVQVGHEQRDRLHTLRCRARPIPISHGLMEFKAITITIPRYPSLWKTRVETITRGVTVEPQTIITS